MVTYHLKKVERLQKAHVHVLASTKEGFPTPVFETALCGTPSIVSDAVGMRDCVENGINGLFYPLGNYKKLAEDIVSVLQDANLRKQLGENAFNYWKDFP